MALRFGDIVLIEVQFHQTRGSKIRPATVVLDSGDEDFRCCTDHVPTVRRGVRSGAAGLAKCRLERGFDSKTSQNRCLV